MVSRCGTRGWSLWPSAEYATPGELALWPYEVPESESWPAVWPPALRVVEGLRLEAMAAPQPR